MLPPVLGRTSWQNLGAIVALAFAIYIITTLLRFLWVRFKLVNIQSTNLNRDSLLMALYLSRFWGATRIYALLES